MNKSYLYIDGKCIIYDENDAIKDENGKIDLKTYNNNFDEILKEENIIEALEDDLDEIKQDIPKTRKRIKFEKKWTIFNVIMTGLIPVFMQQIIKYAAGPENVVNLMSSVVGPILKGLTVVATISCGSIAIIPTWKDYIKQKKRLNGQLRKKEELEKTIEQEKSKLEELNETREETKLKDNISSHRVEYLNRLLRIRNQIDVYYGIAANKEKYLKYLQAGKLERKLSKYYTDEEIEIIKEELMKEEYSKKLK